MGPYIAIIPARGGSKRIPRKNIRPMAGTPLIGRTIDTARQSGLFERVVVSTDDEEIAEISRNFGAEVPFRRPEELSDDLCPTRPVIAHAVRFLIATGQSNFSATCVMFREPENFNRRSQDLLETFYDAGQFYWSTNDYWLSNRPEETYRRRLYELPRDRVCDIDTEDDWEFTELLLALRLGRTDHRG